MSIADRNAEQRDGVPSENLEPPYDLIVIEHPTQCRETDRVAAIGNDQLGGKIRALDECRLARALCRSFRSDTATRAAHVRSR